MKSKLLLALLLCVLCFASGSAVQAATFIVTKVADTNDGACDADCSLREALAAANANADFDSVGFDATVFNAGKVIFLSETNGPLTISNPVQVDGENKVLVSGSGKISVFDISGGSSISLSRLTVTSGQGALSAAGGLRVNGAQVSMTFCTISSNVGGNGFGFGSGAPGAIRVENGGALRLSRCLVQGNRGGRGGTGSTGGAGAVFVTSGSTLTAQQSTFSSNSGGNGGKGSTTSLGSPNGGNGGVGGIFNQGFVNMGGCTIAYNQGGEGGTKGKTGATDGKLGSGGVLNSNATFTPDNTLFANNNPSHDLPDIAADFSGYADSNGYNLVSDSAGSTGFDSTGDLRNVDARLSNNLTNSGGPTLTLELLPGSPAINAGNPAYDLEFNRYDQRGAPFSRIYGRRVDIGAFEVQLPVVTVGSDGGFTEGSIGTFGVYLSDASTETVTVSYATQNGTATAPADYIAKSGTVTFAPGEREKLVQVTVHNDTLDEAEEFLRINLSAPVNALLGTNPTTIKIADNNPAPVVSINNISVNETNTGTVNATFTLSLSKVSEQTIKINAIPTNGTAKAPGDYTSGGATITFAPGETNKTFSVPVKGDLLDETNEVFYVLLSTPVNCTVGTGRGIGTIVDDDAPPTILIDDISVKEYNGGQTTAALRLRLSAPSGQAVRVNYATANGTATAGSDYGAVAPTQIAFNTNSLYAYARVLINGDLLNEANETFLVNLSSPLNATIADNQGAGTILNDDAAPSLTINDVSVSEGNTGTKNLTLTVTLSKASGQTVAVNYATADGIARSTSDYVAKTGTLTFAPGSALTRTISITINSDTLSESDENLFILLSGAVNASISKARGVGTILNDDTSG